MGNADDLGRASLAATSREAAGATGTSQGERARTSLLPLVGIGFWQAWWMCTSSTDAVIGAGPLGRATMRLLLLMTLLGYVALVMLAHRLAPYRAHPAAIPLAAVTGVLGTLVIAATTHSPSCGAAAWMLTMVGLAFVSISGALVLVMWGERWSTLAAGSVGRQLVCSFVVAFAIYLVMPWIPWQLSAALCGAFLAISAASLVAAWREPERADPVSALLLRPAPVTLTLFALLAISIAFGACIATTSSSDADRYRSMLLAAVLMAAFAAVVVATRSADNPFSFYQPIVPAVASGLILLVMRTGDLRFVGSGIVIFGIYCLDMFVMFAACDLAYRARAKVAVVFGAAIIATRLGTLLGRELMTLLSRAGAVQTDALLAMAIVTVVVGGTAFTEHRLRRSFLPDASSKASDLTVDARCDLLAGKARLTPRERDVMRMIARGRSNAEIAAELGIAQGTVKHHTSNVYRKLGVYDRQELVDLVRAAPATA